tara:strand:+ start:2061 stop:3182 length:1122 start_codon:yes stop_codon:yes gene_type:complete
MKNIPLCTPDIIQKDLDVVNSVFKSGWLAHGEWNHKFEDAFSKEVGCKHSISMNSCTSALEISLKAHQIRGEVIIPSMTWVATANAVINTGNKPVFCEVDNKTRNVTADTISPHINSNTEAIIVVHFGGQVCEMESILSLCKKNKLLLIEDSAETLGGTWKNQKSGSFGVGCFSFFPTKNITTGEGGMLTTNDDGINRKIRALIAHGIHSSTFSRENSKEPWLRSADYAGHNFRMPNPLAALGYQQLLRLDEMNANRQKIAKYYNKTLSDINSLITPYCHPDVEHVYQMYTIEVPEEKRDSLVNYLKNNGIGASVHFAPPVHLQSFYKNLGYKEGILPVTEALSKRLITLPIYSQMRIEDAEFVSKKITNFMS